MALEFNPASVHYVDCGNVLNITGKITVLAWIYPTANMTNSAIITKCEQAEPDLNSWVLLAWTTNKAFFGVWDGAAWKSAISAAFSLNALHLVIGIYDESNVKVYLDLVETVGDAYAGAITASVAKVGIGDYYSFDGTYGFTGKIFGGRAYDRALSAAERRSIYYARGIDNIVNNLDARWLMNEKPDGQTAAGANSVIDISGNGNHGTPVNSPVYRAAPVRLVKPII